MRDKTRNILSTIQKGTYWKGPISGAVSDFQVVGFRGDNVVCRWSDTATFFSIPARSFHAGLYRKSI